MNDRDAQLALSLPSEPPRYDRETFYISDANRAAWQCVNSWWASSEPVLVIAGPAGAGKSHLLHIATHELGGRVDDAHYWTKGAERPACIGIDNLPASDPKQFLSYIEGLTTSNIRLVLTGDGHPAEWACGLKDLRTRIEAMPRASLGEPDEALLRTVIAKSFRDRQVLVDPRVIDYAAPRLSRTFAAAQAFVTLSDQEALKMKQKISTSLAQKIINDMQI